MVIQPFSYDIVIEDRCVLYVNFRLWGTYISTNKSVHLQQILVVRPYIIKLLLDSLMGVPTLYGLGYVAITQLLFQAIWFTYFSFFFEFLVFVRDSFHYVSILPCRHLMALILCLMVKLSCSASFCN